jgi:hypothetical protein
MKAFDTLKPGTYDNVAIEFNGNVLGLGASEVIFERNHHGKAAALFANVQGTRVSTLILAGKVGADLADKGESAMTDFALDWLLGMFGSSIKKSIIRTQAFSWNKQPWTLGAFSSANPGARDARKALAESVNNVLWFPASTSNLRTIKIRAHHPHSFAVAPVELGAPLLELDLLRRERATGWNVSPRRAQKKPVGAVPPRSPTREAGAALERRRALNRLGRSLDAAHQDALGGDPIPRHPPPSEEA